MVEGMSVVVNVMSLMSVMSPPPALCNLSARTVMKLCTLSVFSVLNFSIRRSHKIQVSRDWAIDSMFQLLRLS